MARSRARFIARRRVIVDPHYLRRRRSVRSGGRVDCREDLRERKAIYGRASDAFVALPGGFGTMEEILEILTLKQLRQQSVKYRRLAGENGRRRYEERPMSLTVAAIHWLSAGCYP